MTFRRYHMHHHAYMGVEKRDHDLPTRTELKWVRNSSWRKFIWQFLFVFMMAHRGILAKPNKWEIINIVFIGCTTTAIYVLIGLTGTLYLLLSTLFGMGLHPVAGHYIHEHFILRPGQEIYSYYGPLNWVTFNVGYHYEHHDFMRIPNRYLPRYRAMTQEYYDSHLSHRSWLWVFWNFATNREVGMGTRFVRILTTR